MSSFNAAQTLQLLQPIREARVLRDGKGHSHVSQQDITAHLIRVFGFGSFDTDVVKVECVFEQERADKNGVATGRFDVCYRALLRLTIRDTEGNEVCHFEDGSTATAQNQIRGDAHDLAYKSALSLAKKRTAINLGDQFGLSLYNKGQLSALVMGTMVMPPTPDENEQPADVQEGVAQQVSLGNDEIDHEEHHADPLVGARIGVKNAWEYTRGTFDADMTAAHFHDWSQGQYINNATADRLDEYANWLMENKPEEATA